MEEDILNYSLIVMFRETPCTRCKLNIKNLDLYILNNFQKTDDSSQTIVVY